MYTLNSAIPCNDITAFSNFFAQIGLKNSFNQHWECAAPQTLVKKYNTLSFFLPRVKRFLCLGQIAPKNEIC